MKFASFPSIESFHHVVKLSKSYPHLAKDPVSYRGKIKLHGTNAAIRVYNNDYLIQSREQIITPENDNVGFAKWVHTKLDFWKSIKHDQEITIYGEWCGPGIQKGTAIQQINNKIFVIFAVMIGTVGFNEENDNFIEDNNKMVIEPDEIKSILGNLPEDVYVLPWFGDVFEVDYLNQITLNPIVKNLNSIIENIENCDPWVKEVFGKEGICEGVVYYPLNKTNRKSFSNFTFKAKGEKHKVTKTKEFVQIDPEVAATIEDFVTLFVTEPRLDQGLTAVGGLDIKNIGKFLKWMGQDILKESKAELEASNLEWSDVQSYVQTACRNWFLIKNKEV